MNTLAFTLGVLSVIAVAFVAVLIWGIVKVVKQEKQIKGLQLIDEETRQFLHKAQDELYREIRTNQDEVFRHTTHHVNDLSRVVEDDRKEIRAYVNDQITDAVTQSRAYTDHRIDKLMDGNKPKQVIKG
jgi:hypothetical protein